MAHTAGALRLLGRSSAACFPSWRLVPARLPASAAGGRLVLSLTGRRRACAASGSQFGWCRGARRPVLAWRAGSAAFPCEPALRCARIRLCWFGAWVPLGAWALPGGELLRLPAHDGDAER